MNGRPTSASTGSPLGRPLLETVTPRFVWFIALLSERALILSCPTSTSDTQKPHHPAGSYSPFLCEPARAVHHQKRSPAAPEDASASTPQGPTAARLWREPDDLSADAGLLGGLSEGCLVRITPR
jgi:hypothetical protein